MMRCSKSKLDQKWANLVTTSSASIWTKKWLRSTFFNVSKTVAFSKSSKRSKWRKLNLGLNKSSFICILDCLFFSIVGQRAMLAYVWCFLCGECLNKQIVYYLCYSQNDIMLIVKRSQFVKLLVAITPTWFRC